MVSAQARLTTALAVALCVASCATVGNSVGLAGDVRTANGLADATAVAWTYYGRTDKPPRVRLVQGDDLTCVDPISGTPGFQVLLTSGIGCRNGFTISPWEVSISWTGQAWHLTALAHELQHVRQWRALRVVDPGHLRIEWSTDVPAAAGLLQARGF